MPKKKCSKKATNPNFTINDCANAPKPVSRVKKSSPDKVTPELSWDQIPDDDFDIIEEVNADGTKKFVCKKNRNHSNSNYDPNDCPGIVYPEIVWYLISQYIKPEEIGTFARINTLTYAITQRETFWRTLYKRHCENHPKLPEKLRLENNYKLYGLRTSVIRALYHTYEVFVSKVTHEAIQDSRPHLLVKRRCVNVWYSKSPWYWSVYFKFKRINPFQRNGTAKASFIEELGRIDANPEDDTQVLQVTCQNFHELPPVMGMILSSVNVILSQSLRYHKLHLGFNSGLHVSSKIVPECSVVLHTIKILVFDWWHPKYPHFDNTLPTNVREDESTPFLMKDFFAIKDFEF